MKRLRCSACNYDDLEVFLDLGDIPIADAYLDNQFELSPKFPLQLAICSSCWLVQLTEVIDEQTLFGTGYSFYTSASQPLVRYHQDYAEQIKSTHKDLDKHFLVEIGCNDGTMLSMLQSFFTLGVDPAKGPVEAARDRGLDVLNDSFGINEAKDIRMSHGPAKIIIANHVLAHVENVSDMLEGIAYLLADDGFAYIEVQYLPDLLVNNAFDLVYHEHRNFFSISSMAAALYQHGLQITSIQQTNRQGGSVRFQIRHNSQINQSITNYQSYRSEEWLRGIQTYRGFQGRIERVRERLLYLLDAEESIGSHIIGYGAPAKATTLLNFCGIDTLTCVVDTTEAKQGRYIPGVGTPILAPTPGIIQASSAILLLAWNYASSIIRQHRTDDTNLRWILPIPAPMKL